MIEYMAKVFAQVGRQPERLLLRGIRAERRGYLSVFGYRADGHSKEVVERGHAVAVLPVNFRRRVAYLVEQARPAAAFASAAGRAALETGTDMTVTYQDVAALDFCAGMIDAGETPEQAAVRELAEETGIIVQPEHLRRLFTYFNSVGCMTETTACFLAELPDPLPHEPPVGDGEENITVWEMTFDEVSAALDAGRIRTSSGVALAQYLKLNS
jgi:ADP-ribose pyrophosphatase